MNNLKNDRFLRALLRQPVDMTPVWIMRQAGRYLPEYRATREKAGSFMQLCTTPELACEVTLQPLKRFPLDAAIPDAMGLGLHFADGEGPQFKNPVRTAADVKRLGVPDPEDKLRYVMDAVRLIRRELDGRVPLIGFAGSPWTLATYMIEGGSSKDFALTKKMLYDQPALLHELLATTARAVTEYLNAQIAAGVQAVMLFDTWGGALSPRDYQEFSLRYMREIVAGLTRDAQGSGGKTAPAFVPVGTASRSALPPSMAVASAAGGRMPGAAEAEGRKVPVILFTKGGGQWLEAMAETGCDALGIDWTTDLKDARARVGNRVALQGNMDPSVLYASPDRIRAEVGTVLASFGHGSGHVFNLGHGIHAGINPDHVAALVETVHVESRKYHV
jgi:uroporphyrinogen decarboxylase